MQIVENWSEIEGTVRSRKPGYRKGFDAIEIAVDSLRPVEGVANLLADAAGSHLIVLVPDEIARRHAISTGDTITCRVRLARPGQVFVHQDHLSVHPRDNAFNECAE